MFNCGFLLKKDMIMAMMIHNGTYIAHPNVFLINTFFMVNFQLLKQSVCIYICMYPCSAHLHR